MSKKILIIYAHPEPSSLTRQLVDVSVECLTAQGHEVLQSDLYAMGWKAIFDEHDFPQRANPQRLSFGAESAHAYRHRSQSPDVAAEQDKVLAADVVIFQFPLWWYGMPAIMKGWIDRVWAAGLAHGYKDAGNAYRYGDGAFKGKRAMLSVAVGGPAEDYSPRGINGPLEQLLFPITHGSLYFPWVRCAADVRHIRHWQLDRRRCRRSQRGLAHATRGFVHRCADTLPAPKRWGLHSPQ